MKKLSLSLLLSIVMISSWAQGNDATAELSALQDQNIERAMALVDNTIEKCFTGNDNNFKMGDVWNFSTSKSEGTADVWPYTAALEAVNSIVEALETIKDRRPELYNTKKPYYTNLFKKLFDNMDYYKGTYTLTSYAQRATWTVFGVHRGGSKGTATVTGIENVYDDQMWIIRELIRAYHLMGEASYLDEAELLAAYVIDGWDCCLDSNGQEYGGITWGPGYNSKHSCSNGSFVSPLVWLAEQYVDQTDATMTHRYIDTTGKRCREKVAKNENYLSFAKKVYDFQKSHLYRSDNGLYWDMLGADGTLQYETYNGMEYRAHVDTGSPTGTCYTYNSGTMLSGAVDLYQATGEQTYLDDLTLLARKAWTGFRALKRVGSDRYYQFPTDDSAASGFNAWFNNVLMRAFVEAYDYEQTNSGAALDAYQRGLDYAWDNFLRDGFLPINWLFGWNDDTTTKGFHQLAFAAEYAKLTVYQEKKKVAAAVNRVVKQPTNRHKIYTLSGQALPDKANIESHSGHVYIVDGRKVAVR